MEEAHIHLPLWDNDRRPLVDQRRQVLDMILGHFGGYTVTEGQGAWRDPETGRVYTAPVKRVTVAADWNDARNTRSLLSLARFAAIHLRQECIYLAFPSGVQFVSGGEASLVAAE